MGAAEVISECDVTAEGVDLNGRLCQTIGRPGEVYSRTTER